MSLPASFFRKYSPGELKSRSMSVNQLCSMLMSMVMTTGLTSLTSLLYVTQIFRFAPKLVVPSLLIVLVTVGFSVVTTFVQIGINRKRMEHAARESGMSYSMISGIQKIKLAGAEKRSFAKWLNLYAEGAELKVCRLSDILPGCACPGDHLGGCACSASVPGDLLRV